MSGFSDFLKDQLKDEKFKKEYFRIHFLDDLVCQLIRLRNKRGLSQIALAEKACTTQSVVSRVESGSNYPSLRTLQKLVESLDGSIKIDIIPNEEMNYSQFYLESLLFQEEPKSSSGEFDNYLTHLFSKSVFVPCTNSSQHIYINEFTSSYQTRINEKS